MPIRVVLALAALLVPAAPAAAQVEAAPWAPGMTPDGRPTLEVRYPVGGDAVTVHRCPGGMACGGPLPFTFGNRGGRLFGVDLGSIAPGDVLELRRTARDGRLVSTLRTPPWRGTPKRLSAPTVTGALTFGQTVQADHAAFSDAGWAPGWRNVSESSLVACRTAAGEDCFDVAVGSILRLDEGVVGRYLFATTTHSFYDGVISDSVPGMVAIGDLPRLGPLEARSAPLGPIPGPAAFRVRPGARWVKGRIDVGAVRCDRPCTVRVTGLGSKTIRRTLTVKTSARLVLKDRNEPSILGVQVSIDGREPVTAWLETP